MGFDFNRADFAISQGKAGWTASVAIDGIPRPRQESVSTQEFGSAIPYYHKLPVLDEALVSCRRSKLC